MEAIESHTNKDTAHFDVHTVDKEREVPVQRLADDQLSVWQALKLYKRAAAFCFLAALTASLDGYQGESRLVSVLTRSNQRFNSR